MTTSAAEASRSTNPASSNGLVRVIAKPRRRDFFFAYLREYCGPKVAWLWILLGAALAGVTAAAVPVQHALFLVCWAVFLAAQIPVYCAAAAALLGPHRRVVRMGQVCVLSDAGFVFDTELGFMQFTKQSLRRFRETKHNFVLGSFSTRLVVIPKKDFASTADAERFADGITRLGS